MSDIKPIHKDYYPLYKKNLDRASYSPTEATAFRTSQVSAILSNASSNAQSLANAAEYIADTSAQFLLYSEWIAKKNVRIKPLDK